MIKKYLNKLSHILKNIGLEKVAQEINELSNEWDEPWHEEAIKEFGGEPISEEEYLEKEIKHKSPRSWEAAAYSVMNKEGFKPLMHGGSIDGALIGMGSYGKVFRGTYNGKDAVMKIVIERYFEYDDEDTSKEVDNWKRIYEVASKLPGNLRRHIPIIYKVGNGEVPIEEGVDYEFIIMEPLFRLHENIYEKIRDFYNVFDFQPTDEYLEEMMLLFKDEEFLYSIAKRILDEYLHKITEENEAYLLSKIHKELLGINVKELVLKGKDLENIDNIAKAITKDLVNSGAVQADMYKSQKDKIAYDILSILKENAAPGSFPITHEDLLSGKGRFYDLGDPEVRLKMSYWLKNPETKSFLELLIFLYENFGIAWNDVHEDNIMMDKDGTLKLIDVGLFE